MFLKNSGDCNAGDDCSGDCNNPAESSSECIAGEDGSSKMAGNASSHHVVNSNEWIRIVMLVMMALVIAILTMKMIKKNSRSETRKRLRFIFRPFV